MHTMKLWQLIVTFALCGGWATSSTAVVVEEMKEERPVVEIEVMEERPVVEVSQGRILGLTREDFGVGYLSFEGIPYALPPTGARRFKDPGAAGGWDGYLDANQLPPPCIQFVVGGREDCLYLNVYTPLDALATDIPRPVMVFIHGGAFYLGSTSLNHGFQTLVDKGVVVVALQYRLGVLGFLSTEDSAAPGNLGLKDQTLALQWVKDNINSFGGDPERITLFGGSAGAASVHYQMLAPSAAGLFHGAIFLSGTAVGPWARGRKFREAANTIATKFGCPTEDSEALVECLQEVNPRLLDETEFSFIEWNVQPFLFAPRVDGHYLPDEPVTLMKEGRFHHVPTIMAINAHEMAIQSVEMYADPLLTNHLTEDFESVGPVSLALFNDEDPIATATNIFNYYLGGVNLGKENADNMTQMYSDGYFLMPHDWATELMADHIPLYTAELVYRGQHGFTNYFLNLGLDLPEAANYVAHGDQKQYLLNPGHGRLSIPDDLVMGDLHVALYTNFAYTGNPTPDESLGFIWATTTADAPQHLALTPSPAMAPDTRAHNRKFWESLPIRVVRLMNQ